MAVDSRPVWASARVLAVDDVALDVRRVVLAPATAVPARPGSHVDVRLPSPNLPGRDLVRSYSVVASEDDGRRLVLTVHRARASRGGSLAMHALRPGEEIVATQPLQNFPLGVGAARYVLLAGGIGITAVMAMAAALRARGADYRFVVAGRTREAVPYLDELTALHGDRLRVHLDDGAADADHAPLDVEAVVREIASHPAAARTELYQCGPVGLMEAVGAAWRAHALPPANLRFETFGASMSGDQGPFVLRLPGLGREVAVPAQATALEALEAAGVPVLAECRRGECGLCLVEVRQVEGELAHRDVFLDPAQKRAGDRMCLCVSRIVGPAAGATLDLA
ncbi:2Fe-2S iron-sulfur cluster-binding protein [Nocardioides sp.]|uniref:PDR/VanB family oxidoreductase n=1 Tax=Nocardioides sp. TaxID=35761 RepID=UPI003511182A